MLAGTDVQPVDLEEARAAGELLATSGTSDVVDAMLVRTAVAGDQVLTSDPEDITRLAAARSVSVTIVRV